MVTCRRYSRNSRCDSVPCPSLPSPAVATTCSIVNWRTASGLEATKLRRGIVLSLSLLYSEAERYASGAVDSRSDVGAKAIGGRLHALVRRRSAHQALSEQRPPRPALAAQLPQVV